MLKELIERKVSVNTEDPVVAGRFVDLIFFQRHLDPKLLLVRRNSVPVQRNGISTVLHTGASSTLLIMLCYYISFVFCYMLCYLHLYALLTMYQVSISKAFESA